MTPRTFAGFSGDRRQGLRPDRNVGPLVLARTPGSGGQYPAGMTAFVDEMRAGGHVVSEWSNAAGDKYPAHSHPYKKVLCCLHGTIVFHLVDRDVDLREGDQLVLDPGVEHSATVGPSGVHCAEAHLR